MGNFLIIASSDATGNTTGDAMGAGRLFQEGLDCARRIKGQKPSDVIQTEWANAAVFNRLNGAVSAIARDASTGSWLLAAGSWFHNDGYASGSEENLLRLMLGVGPDRVSRELEGFFVVIFGDGRSREVVIMTDPIGSRHCFTRSAGRHLAVSSSSLILASLAGSTLDPVGCREYLRTGVIFENRTLFKEIHKIAPAQVVRFASAELSSQRRYWRIDELDPEKFEGQKAAQELGEKVIAAVRKVGRLFDRPVCDLTGGYDSRAMVAAFLAGGGQFETTVAGPHTSADVVVSRGLSEITGRPHHHFEVDGPLPLESIEQAVRLTDGEYDPVHYARVFSLHRRLSERFDVSINGSFGELSRGYWWELLWPGVGRRRPIDARMVAARRYVVEPVCSPLFPAGADLPIDHYAAVIDRANAGLDGLPNTAQMDNTYLSLRMQRWQGRIAGSTDQIWPCLSPFMMRSVLETMLQTAAKTRQHSLLARMMINNLNRDLARYPLESGHPAMPLSWQTWPRFLPASQVLAKKAFYKIGNRIGIRAADIPGNIREPMRLRLWREPLVAGLLTPEKMGLNELMERSNIGNFLEASRQGDFGYDQVWNRVLGLEMAMRIIREEREIH